MIVFCEECGERYVIDPKEIKGSVMMFICRVCSDVIKVTLPDNMASRRVGTERTGT